MRTMDRQIARLQPYNPHDLTRHKETVGFDALEILSLLVTGTLLVGIFPQRRVEFEDRKFARGDKPGPRAAHAQQEIQIGIQARRAVIGPSADALHRIALQQQPGRRKNSRRIVFPVSEISRDLAIVRSLRPDHFKESRRQVCVGLPDFAKQRTQMIRVPDIVVSQERDIAPPRQLDSHIVRRRLMAGILLQIVPADAGVAERLRHSAGIVRAPVSHHNQLEILFRLPQDAVDGEF